MNNRRGSRNSTGKICGTGRRIVNTRIRITSFGFQCRREKFRYIAPLRESHISSSFLSREYMFGRSHAPSPRYMRGWLRFLYMSVPGLLEIIYREGAGGEGVHKACRKDCRVSLWHSYTKAPVSEDPVRWQLLYGAVFSGGLPAPPPLQPGKFRSGTACVYYCSSVLISCSCYCTSSLRPLLVLGWEIWRMYGKVPTAVYRVYMRVL